MHFIHRISINPENLRACVLSLYHFKPAKPAHSLPISPPIPLILLHNTPATPCQLAQCLPALAACLSHSVLYMHDKKPWPKPRAKHERPRLHLVLTFARPRVRGFSSLFSLHAHGCEASLLSTFTPTGARQKKKIWQIKPIRASLNSSASTNRQAQRVKPPGQKVASNRCFPMTGASHRKARKPKASEQVSRQDKTR